MSVVDLDDVRQELARESSLLMFDIRRLNELHQYSAGHRQMIERSDQCGCFHCGAIFPSHEIDEWCDEPEDGVFVNAGTTALCPRCGIDAVLPDNAPGIVLNAEWLTAMREHFF